MRLELKDFIIFVVLNELLMKSYAVKPAIDTVIGTRFSLTIGPVLISLFSNSKNVETYTQSTYKKDVII